MKSIISFLIATTLFSFSAIAQTDTAPDGAAGVKYGMNPNEVMAVWKTKGTLGQDYKITNGVIGSIMFTDFTLGTEKFDLCGGKFVNNKLYEITLWKVPERVGDTQEIFNRLEVILNGIYKKGNQHRLFSGAYEDGDGYEMQAVKLGKGKIQTFWDYSPISVINLEIVSLDGSTIMVSLVYQSDELFKEVDTAQRNANKDEF